MAVIFAATTTLGSVSAFADQYDHNDRNQSDRGQQNHDRDSHNNSQHQNNSNNGQHQKKPAALYAISSSLST